MDRYIGLDVHSQSTTLAIVAANGKRLSHKVLETSATALINELQQLSGRKHLILEEGTQSTWLSIVLRPHVSRLVVTSPREERQKNKSDIEDAYARAEELRTNAQHKTIYKPHCDRDVELQQALRLYRYLTKDVVRAKNRFKASLRSWGVVGLERDVYDEDIETLQPLMEQVPPGVAHNAGEILKQIQMLETLRKPARDRLVQEAQRRQEYRVLLSVPGLGALRVSTLLAIVVTPGRFPKTRKFWSYVGLAVRTHATGEWARNGTKFERQRAPLTRGLKPGSPALKEVFKGAAQTVVNQKDDSKLKQHYQQLLAHGMRPNLALLTLARKIAAITLAAWKSNEEYEEEKHTALK